MNDIPPHHKGIQISTAAFCAQRPRAGPGVCDTNRTLLAFTETDRLILTMKTRPAPQPDLFSSAESLSRLTLDLYTSSAGSPSSGPEGCGDRGVSVTVCLCMWTQKTVTSYDMKRDWRILSQLESTGGSTMLTVLQSPI